MEPGDLPGASLRVPGDLPGASREPVGTFFCDSTKIDEDFEAPRARPEAVFGSQPGQAGTQNLLKNGIVTKKAVSGSVFVSDFCKFCLSSSFSVRFFNCYKKAPFFLSIFRYIF